MPKLLPKEKKEKRKFLVQYLLLFCSSFFFFFFCSSIAKQIFAGLTTGRVKSPEWRWQWRRADLRYFEIFRHGPIIIYTRLPAGGTYYLICMFPPSSEYLIGISDAFSTFCLRVSVTFPTCSLYPQQKRAYSALHVNMVLNVHRNHKAY